MTNMRDEIESILWDNRQNNGIDVVYIADAILEALPNMIAPLVWGPMQWDTDSHGCDAWGEFSGSSTFTSMTNDGSYAIYQFSETEFMWTQGTVCNWRFSTYRPMNNPDWVPTIPWHPTTKDAQDAANTHHRAAIMAAFTGAT